jgi:hypothetical protein
VSVKLLTDWNDRYKLRAFAQKKHYDGFMELLDDFDTLQASIARVRELHKPDPERIAVNWDSGDYNQQGPACAHCIDCGAAGGESVFWPCETIRALEGGVPQ